MPAQTTRRRRRTLAQQADRHELYEKSVQDPVADSAFLARTFERVTGEQAIVLREDFCGTANLASHWVTMRRAHRAVGVDLHGPTLAWGRKRNLDRMTEEQRARIELIQGDVRTVRKPLADVTCALNFSYCVFKTRDAIGAYLANAVRSLRPGGVFLLDAWGGSATQTVTEERRRVGKFTYRWDQARFDPLTYETTCKIHFEFKDGSVLRDAFVYDWRLWTLPELRELFTAAGFTDVHILWEGTDRASGEGNGVYRRIERGTADPAWIAYVVGRRARR